MHNFKRIPCPSCQTKIEPGHPCQVCGTMSEFGDAGRLVFTLRAHESQISETPFRPPMPKVDPDVPEQEYSDAENDVQAVRLTHRHLAGLDKAIVDRSKAPKDWSPDRTLTEGPDLEGALREPEDNHGPVSKITEADFKQTMTLGPDFAELLRGR